MCSPLLISISVYAGHQAEGFRKLCPLGSSVIERWYVAPGVKRVSVRERGVRGTLFIPPGELFLSAWLFLALHVFAGFKGLPPAPCALVSRLRTLPGCAGHVGGWRRAGGVSLRHAGLPRLRQLGAGVSLCRGNSVGQRGVPLLRGPCWMVSQDSHFLQCHV